MERVPTDAAPVVPARDLDAAASGSEDWWVWQWIDSSFPTGGFAHSGGLEAAWQHGAVRSREDCRAYLAASLDQAGHAALPWVTAAHRELQRLQEWDEWCDAFTSNHVANRASRAQGRALWAAALKTFGEERLRPLPNSAAVSVEAPGHYAPRFGAILGRLGLPVRRAQRLFLFGHLRSLLASAVRLGIVGPMEAQAMQFRLAQQGETVLERCATLEPEDASQTQPLHDLWQGAQDRLYSRLFQS